MGWAIALLRHAAAQIEAFIGLTFLTQGRKGGEGARKSQDKNNVMFFNAPRYGMAVVSSHFPYILKMALTS